MIEFMYWVYVWKNVEEVFTITIQKMLHNSTEIHWKIFHGPYK